MTIDNEIEALMNKVLCEMNKNDDDFSFTLILNKIEKMKTFLTKTYNNKLTEFIDEFLERKEKNIISIKQIMIKYQSSEYYNELTNKQKRDVKLSTFKERIKTNIILKKYFKVINKKNVIKGWDFKK